MRNFSLFLLFVLFSINACSQEDLTKKKYSPIEASHLRISLITCGKGNEIWQTFGHTAFRIIDSDKVGAERDMIYNYGVRDGFDGSFFWTFVTGKLVVFLGLQPFAAFVHDYQVDGRSIEEQVFLLTENQKERILAFLNNNAQIENRCYEYQIFFDNCCTRARDVFPKVFGDSFAIGKALPDDFHLSYRTAFNLYYRDRYWERVGVNICMGSTTDTLIENRMITFLPEFLSIAMEHSMLNGNPICDRKTTVLEDHINHSVNINQPFIVSCLILILTILGLSLRRFRYLGLIMKFLVLGISGFLSICVLFHWFYSAHVYGGNNFNLFWAMPLNIFIWLINFKGKGLYGIVGILFIFVSLLVHILRIQIMPLFELGPYLAALLCVYGDMYRNDNYAIALINRKFRLDEQ